MWAVGLMSAGSATSGRSRSEADCGMSPEPLVTRAFLRRRRYRHVANTTPSKYRTTAITMPAIAPAANLEPPPPPPPPPGDGPGPVVPGPDGDVVGTVEVIDTVAGGKDVTTLVVGAAEAAPAELSELSGFKEDADDIETTEDASLGSPDIAVIVGASPTPDAAAGWKLA